MLQVQSYSFPLFLVTPLLSAMTSIYSMHGASNGVSLITYFMPWISPNSENIYIGWRVSYTKLNTENFEMALIVIVGIIIGLMSLMFLTFYLWNPNQNKLERTEVLFVKPIYGGPLITEELLLNRRQYLADFLERKDRKQKKEEKENAKLNRKGSSKKKKTPRKRRRKTQSQEGSSTPQVFLCATMWHETEKEMTQLLTSIMRLDNDQWQRSSKPKDQDFYNFQVHILFDDAMEAKGNNVVPNKFVNKLVELIPESAKKIISNIQDDKNTVGPYIYPTPYGGRLDFLLPCGNLLHVHLKDKSKIRHRKRWSQCMYLYYILGYLQEAEKSSFKSQDVFILALDGDVDFQPVALRLLLDRMKRNPEVGAACGRIHPVGTGPVVWFQKFEYAVGHWLQKSTEHVLGCVLCSPGCFSLFRGEALMADNVMHKYTTKPSEASHYIQWDQGEDRWLCTLLLKSGFRIEYSAASESFTFAPEEFKEFYNQRRRWGPSTMANIFDILINASWTVKFNNYISWPYIAYQTGLMASTILGPSTVVLIIQGAFAYVFGMSPLGSLLIALVPVIIFIILCYTTSQDFQIVVAGILTLIYALVMMAVLVGIIGQMTESLLNPNSLFMLAMIGIYAFTGIIHPTEMFCLIHGLLYYLCVPSAFILLMVYSLVNMNNVTWGTREVKGVGETEASLRALQEVANKNKNSGKNIQLAPNDASPISTDGYYSCGLGSLCQCAMCIAPDASTTTLNNGYQRVPTENNMELEKKSQAPVISKSQPNPDAVRKYSLAKAKYMGNDTEKDPKQIAESIRKGPSVAYLRERPDLHNVAALKQDTKRRRETEKIMFQSHQKALELMRNSIIEDENNQNRKTTGVTGVDSDEEIFDEVRHEDEKEQSVYWIVDGNWNGEICNLEPDEHRFWKKMIHKYLQPLEKNEKEEKRIKADLITLRNKMTGAYFLINGLWLVLTFSLTLAIQDINITFYDKKGNEIVLQPLSFLFLIFFLVILLIQFVTMLIHRWSTFIHLIANAKFKTNSNQDESNNNGQGELKKGQNTKNDVTESNIIYTNKTGQTNQAFEVNVILKDPHEKKNSPKTTQPKKLYPVNENFYDVMDAEKGLRFSEMKENVGATTDESESDYEELVGIKKTSDVWRKSSFGPTESFKTKNEMKEDDSISEGTDPQLDIIEFPPQDDRKKSLFSNSTIDDKFDEAIYTRSKIVHDSETIFDTTAF